MSQVVNALTALAQEIAVDPLPLKQIERAGFEIMKEAHIGNADLGIQVFYVLDPDGVRLELIDIPGDPTQPLGEPIRPEDIVL